MAQPIRMVPVQRPASAPCTCSGGTTPCKCGGGQPCARCNPPSTALRVQNDDDNPK